MKNADSETKNFRKKNKKEIQTQQEEIYTEDDDNLIWKGQFQWKLILTSLTQQII